MAYRFTTALMMAGVASFTLMAGAAAAQNLEVRAGTDDIEGEPGSLENVPAPAPMIGPRVSNGYQPPRVLGGLPDLSGSWSNSTITGTNRPRVYGSRLIMTEDEVAAIEGANLALMEAGNEASDPNATIADIEAKGNCSAGRGSRAQACNYDAGWTAPGETVMRVNGQPRTSLLTTPDGQYPRAMRVSERRGLEDIGEGSDEGRAASMGRNDNPETRGLAERCLASFGRSAVPPMFDQLYNSHYQFQLGKDSLAIWVEMVHDVRVIRIGDEHRTDGVRPWFGDSIGWWEGDTLVVETTNIPEQQAYQGSWENLRVIERFTRVAEDRMNYQFEIHDDTMWAEPWGGEYEFWASAPPYEYACHEGNYGLEGILAGARAEEAEAAGVELTTEPVL